MSPDTCPHCGADVPANAKACPECGSDETTGWSEKARYDGLDLPDETFNYEEFTRREFGSKRERLKPPGLHWLWWVIAALLAAAFIYGAFHSLLP